MSSIEIRVNGRYRIDDKLYEGKNCSVYTGKNVYSDTDCSIKCQTKTINPSFVLNQGKVLEILQGGIGIPHLLWHGQNGDFRFVITQLLGNNLQEYLDICGGKFSLKTTLMIAERIISSIEFIHYKNFLHRDIKPENFLMGLGKKLHQIYTVDLAHASMYVDPKTKQIRPNIKNQDSFVGTLHFLSLNVLKGNTYSRRDDLQSIGLMLVYFLKGSLPWSNVNGQSLKQIRRNIIKIRQEIPNHKLCQNLPSQFEQYFQCVKNLKYDQIPDYTYLRRILKERSVMQGYQLDYIYDWILIPIRSRDHDLSSRIPLNRSTKKQDPSLLMSNYHNHDFESDFQILIKRQQLKHMQTKNSQEFSSGSRTKRSFTTTQTKSHQKTGNLTNKHKDKSGKNSKDDCLIF